MNVKEIKEKYPRGTKLQLIKMDDVQAPPEGTIGIVKYVDDAASIHVRWETGSSLSLIPDVDEFKIIE